MADRVVRWREREPLMDTFGVEREIKSTLSRRVDLPSGGYLIFDYAEAFTVIDVNTGRFVGSRSKKSGARLEDTITKNNLEAVKEVVRQLRLRDIGGIIVIDFIDMANPKNRQQVEEALRVELERDRTKTYVVEISPLGLVEMTRQNVTDGPREVMTKKCPTCGGDGIVVSEHTAAVDVERRLRALVTPGSRSKAFKVELNSKIVALVVGSAGERLRELEETTKRRFFLVGKDDLHLDHFKVLDQGLLEKVAPQLPVDVGAELDVKPVEVGLHDSRSAVAKLDGMDISIGNAAKLVGRKVKVRITAVAEGIAWAELLSPVEASDAPLTAEAEAEKPTRARRTSSRKTSATVVETVEGEAVDDEPSTTTPSSRTSRRASSRRRPRTTTRPMRPSTASGDAEAGTGPPKKKRTRRGTRGGRNRKRPPAADGTAALNEASEDAAVVDDELTEVVEERADVQRDAAIETEADAETDGDGDDGEAAPVIHLPDPSLGTDGSGEVRKRTRRGSRGGRNRRKKPVGAAANGAVSVVDADAEPDLVGDIQDDEHDEPELVIVEEVVVEEEAPAEAEAAVEEEVVEEEAVAEADIDDEPVEEAAADGEWTYTPMSDWGLDDRR